jgi:hypothetical protein
LNQALFPVNATPVAETVSRIETAVPFDALLPRRRAKISHFLKKRHSRTFLWD